jgi:hypothetical protein
MSRTCTLSGKRGLLRTTAKKEYHRILVQRRIGPISMYSTQCITSIGVQLAAVDVYLNICDEHPATGLN